MDPVRLSAAVAALAEALRPLARMLDTAELLGGPSRLQKDEDTLVCQEVATVGRREITLGDLKRARAALAEFLAPPPLEYPEGDSAAATGASADFARLAERADAYVIHVDGEERNLGAAIRALASEVDAAVRRERAAMQERDVFMAVLTNMVAAGDAPARNDASFARKCLDAARAAVRGARLRQRMVHRKRGGTYEVIAAGRVQTDVPLLDMAEVVVYVALDDGSVWVRRPAEVVDGRFIFLQSEG